MAAKATLVTLLNCKQEGAPEKKEHPLVCKRNKKNESKKTQIVYNLQHLSTGLVEHLNRLIANILILLQHCSLIGVEHPHAAVEAIHIRFVECNVCLQMVGAYLKFGNYGIVAAHREQHRSIGKTCYVAVVIPTAHLISIGKQLPRRRRYSAHAELTNKHYMRVQRPTP